MEQPRYMPPLYICHIYKNTALCPRVGHYLTLDILCKHNPEKRAIERAVKALCSWHTNENMEGCLVSHIFAFSYCSWGSQGKNTEVVGHSLFQ